jgi:hypothetical protein
VAWNLPRKVERSRTQLGAEPEKPSRARLRTKAHFGDGVHSAGAYGERRVHAPAAPFRTSSALWLHAAGATDGPCVKTRCLFEHCSGEGAPVNCLMRRLAYTRRCCEAARRERQCSCAASSSSATRAMHATWSAAHPECTQRGTLQRGSPCCNAAQHAATKLPSCNTAQHVATQHRRTLQRIATRCNAIMSLFVAKDRDGRSL